MNIQKSLEWNLESNKETPLSATLFGVVLDVIIKQLDIKESMFTNLIQCVLPMLIYWQLQEQKSLIDTFTEIEG